MSSVLEMTAQEPGRMQKLAERDLGMGLRGNEYDVRADLLSPAEAALSICKNSPEYSAGPFSGFKRVLAKTADRLTFENRVGLLSGYMLLLPAGPDTIMRTLVSTIDGGKTVRLDAFGAKTHFGGSRTERVMLSGVHGFYDPLIGSTESHNGGSVKAEPGHVALVNGTVLGGFRAQRSLHGAIHDLADMGKNTLSATVQSPANSQLGVAIPYREYSFDTWPASLELLWHESDGPPESATVSGAVMTVQAAGFVGLRAAGKLPQAMSLLESM